MRRKERGSPGRQNVEKVGMITLTTVHWTQTSWPVNNDWPKREVVCKVFYNKIRSRA